ncbi:MAG: DUF4386 domain-containing protein [Ignavibacteriaceae bacterium]
MSPNKNTARLAGLLYFIWILTGVYGIFFLPSQTFVEGDAAATANKVLSNEFLFRTGIVNDIISNTLWVFMALILYRLFKPVNERYSKLLVALVLVQIPAMFFMEAFNISSLMLFKGKILNSFESAQRQDLAMMFLGFNGYIALVLETFWGLWLFPFGQLVYKSGFIPRILGIFLILNGAAYVVHSFTSLLFPGYQAAVRLFAFPFWILGEISIMLWLLIKGVKTVQPEAA